MGIDAGAQSRLAMTRRTRLPQKNGGPSAGSSRRRLRAPSGALDGVLAHLPERWQNARAAVASGTVGSVAERTRARQTATTAGLA